jgi:cold shock CspA family protein
MRVTRCAPLATWGRGDIMSTMIRQTGRIGHYNAARAYGFIQSEEHELFMHLSDWVSDEEPHVGDRVSFVEKQGRDGRPRAVSVMPAAV